MRPSNKNSTLVPCSRSQGRNFLSRTMPWLCLRSTSTMQRKDFSAVRVFVCTTTPRADVCMAQVVAAEIPIPCCPREQRPRPNFEEAKYSPNTLATSSGARPGPLSSTRTKIRSVLRIEPSPFFSIQRVISGKMPDSSQASSELSTASFKVVSTAFVGDEKPTCCKFLEKYSAVLLVVIFEIAALVISSDFLSERRVLC